MEGMLARINSRVLLEPRGFMKILQFVFSICAFATTTSFSTHFSFSIACSSFDEKPNVTITEEITYPFQLGKIHITYKACGDPEKDLYVMGDFSSDARFFVTVGVLALLYVLVAIGLYCFFSDLYENNGLVPIGDFALHVGFVILLFAASCAWANSLIGLRSVSSLDNIQKYNKVCIRKYTCNNVSEPRFGQLISSDVFGFLDVFLWASNLWFLYKETRFYQERKAGEEANATE